MSKFNQVARIFGTTLLSATAAMILAGCASDTMSAEEESTSTAEENLYYLGSNLWATHNVNVCWTTAGNDTEKLWVRQALTGQRSWVQEGNISLTGWGQCTSTSTGIKLGAGSSMGTYGLGPQSNSSVAMVLDFGASPQTGYTRCVTNSLSREQCIKTVAIHEFGHALAIAHEQNRGDTPATCTYAPQGTNGDTTYGVWDGISIMNYCGMAPNLSGTDRRGFDRMYGSRNGDTVRLGDSNGDGRADLLCHDTTNGNKWADYASASGTFLGTDWSIASGWCSHTTGKLFRGDFNGDGRQDLLCHDVASGYKWIDLASSTGAYAGTDWERNTNWCSHASAQLFIGDANGDGRDDLICHDVSTGRKWIDFADASGAFNGTDWERGAAWCSHATARLSIGDFNGDGRDDLLCHDVASGYKWIDFASTSGTYDGTDWERAAGWCNHTSAQLLVGDFNGDGRDDLLCHDVATGNKWTDLASTAGTFLGTDWSLNTNWCSHSTARLYVGDLNGDGRDDLLCHDVVSGAKWTDLASTAGTFLGTDWSLNSNWCSHDAGELH